jgi:hypothetical protein
MDQKSDGALVNMDTNLASITVTSAAGTVADGDSILTTSAGVSDGAKLMWKAANGTAPSVTYGTALTAADGWADLPASGLINTTNDYKVTVALVAKGSQLPLAAGNTTVVAKT